MIVESEKKAVIVGRFQPLHNGHVALIESIREKFFDEDILIIIGSVNSDDLERNPFSYSVRFKMLKKKFPEIKIIGATDLYDDHLWAEYIDHLVSAVFPGVSKENIQFFTGSSGDFNKVTNETVGLDRSENAISGTSVRSMLEVGDESWKRLVPEEIHNIVESSWTHCK